MPQPCRWCSRPAVETITVDAPSGTPARMALCERHLRAVERARREDPEEVAARRRVAEQEAWQRVFREPAPFS